MYDGDPYENVMEDGMNIMNGTCSALHAKLITFKSRDQHIYINEITGFNDYDNDSMRWNDIMHNFTLNVNFSLAGE